MLPVEHRSLGALFVDTVRRLGDAPFLAHRGHEGWEHISWIEGSRRVRHLGLGLLALGLQPGERVAIYSPNRPEWCLADLAVLSVGGVDVPLYATSSTAEIEHVLADSGCRICLVGGTEQLARLLTVQSQLPELRQIVTFDPQAQGDGTLRSVRALEELGERAVDPLAFERSLAAVGPEQLATLLYTSGTSGLPKGVMLTHGNLLANVEQAYRSHAGRLSPGRRALSFLPLSHALERTGTWYLALRCGTTVHFARSAFTVLDDLREVRPELLVGVPRLFEKLRARIEQEVASFPPLRRDLFRWSVGVGRQVAALTTQRRAVPLGLRLRHRLARRLVLGPLTEALGLDRLLVLVSGAAPLLPELDEFFHALGVPVHEGYGLTEASPLATVNTYEAFRFGTVGRPVTDTELRLAPDGEVQLRGPQVMQGYWNQPSATHEALDAQGWLSTGDIGVLEDGFLRITDRKKDILITAGGKNVSPQNLERALAGDRYIERVAVVGDRRPYLTALIVPAFEALESWAAGKRLRWPDRTALVALPEVRALYQQRLDQFNAGLSRAEQIRRFLLIDHEFSLETGELTPTLKVRRRAVLARYAAQIERMYAAAG